MNSIAGATQFCLLGFARGYDVQGEFVAGQVQGKLWRKPEWLLAAVLIAAAALRLWDLGGPSISHPEVYIPGITLLDGLSEPPPRESWSELFSWHFHDEPHPIGFYAAMRLWTLAFGTSEFALRLPSVLFGVGTVFLLFRLGRRTYGPGPALIAAMLLSLHGFHLHWSQMARMYSPGAFFSVLATLALVHLAFSDRPRKGSGAVYAGALAAGLWTAELTWALLAVHMAWVAVIRPRTGGALVTKEGWLQDPIARCQTMALAIGLPSFAHSLYRSRSGAAPEPSFDFIRDYFAFGFNLEADAFSDPVRQFPVLLLVAAALFGFALAVFGAAKPLGAGSDETTERRAIIGLVPPCLLSSAAILWMASIATRRQEFIAIVALFPIGALVWPVVAAQVRPLVARFLPPLERLIAALAPLAHPVTLLALALPVAVFAASFGMSVLAPRAFLLFTPYLLLLIAAGLWRLRPRKALLLPAGAGLAAVVVAGLTHAIDRPHTPRDYKQLAAAIHDAAQPGDLILIRRKSWADTPILYYLDPSEVIATKDASWIGSSAPERVWVVRWNDDYELSEADYLTTVTPGYESAGGVSARRGRAILMTRSPREGGRA